MPLMLTPETRTGYRLCRSRIKLLRAFRKIVSRNRSAFRQFQQSVRMDNLGGEESSQLINRRDTDRWRLQVPAYLTPAKVVGLRVNPLGSDSQLIVTRDIALQGIGMVHDEPLDQDCYIAEFDVMEDEPIRLLLSVRWTKELNEWSYRTGTMIVGLLKRPVMIDESGRYRLG